MKSEDKRDIEMAWEVYRHVESIKESRTNFFLAVEALLVVAYSELVWGAITSRYMVSVLGAIFSFSWILVTKRFSSRLHFLERQHLSGTAVFPDPSQSSKATPGSFFLNYILQCSTVIFWLALVVHTWLDSERYFK